MSNRNKFRTASPPKRNACDAPSSDATSASSKPNHDPGYLNTRHTSYCKQRDDHNAACLEVSGRYDQWILTLPGGALALSLGFLEKIAPNPVPGSTSWIATAWMTLIVALGSGFSAIYFSQTAIRTQIDILDKEFDDFLNHRSVVKAKNRFATVTEVLTLLSLVAFLAGLSSLCRFAFLNLPKRAMTSNVSQPPVTPLVVTNQLTTITNSL